MTAISAQYQEKLGLLRERNDNGEREYDSVKDNDDAIRLVINRCREKKKTSKMGIMRMSTI